MNNEEYLTQLEEIVLKILPNQSIKLKLNSIASDFKEWDSMNHVKIVLACEKKFNIKLNSRDMNITNVQELIDIIKSKK